MMDFQPSEDKENKAGGIFDEIRDPKHRPGTPIPIYYFSDRVLKWQGGQRPARPMVVYILDSPREVAQTVEW